MSAEANPGEQALPSGLHERRAYDQRKQQPETEAPQGDQPAEAASGQGGPGTSGRLIHRRSIAYPAVGIALGLAQLAWFILVIYATHWLWGKLPL